VATAQHRTLLNITDAAADDSEKGDGKRDSAARLLPLSSLSPPPLLPLSSPSPPPLLPLPSPSPPPLLPLSSPSPPPRPRGTGSVGDSVGEGCHADDAPEAKLMRPKLNNSCTQRSTGAGGEDLSYTQLLKDADTSWLLMLVCAPWMVSLSLTNTRRTQQHA